MKKRRRKETIMQITFETENTSTLDSTDGDQELKAQNLWTKDDIF